MFQFITFTFLVCRNFNLLFEMFSFVIVIVVFRWHYSVTIQIHHNPISIWHAFDEESEKLYFYVIFSSSSSTLYIYFFSCTVFIRDAFNHSNILFSIQHVLIKAERNSHFSDSSILNKLWKKDTLLYCIIVFGFHSIILSDWNHVFELWSFMNVCIKINANIDFSFHLFSGIVHWMRCALYRNMFIYSIQ